MSAYKKAFTILLIIVTQVLFGFRANPHHNSANTLTFGGGSVTVDLTDCSTDNSSDGKSRAIAAINSSTASMVTVQFGSLEPASGTYSTVAEEPIGKNQVIIGAGGSTFDGSFVAVAGQVVVVTHAGQKYNAAFKDITLKDPVDNKIIVKKLSGDIGCD